jgi:hypothetical protein
MLMRCSSKLMPCGVSRLIRGASFASIPHRQLEAVHLSSVAESVLLGSPWPFCTRLQLGLIITFKEVSVSFLEGLFSYPSDITRLILEIL